MRNPLFTRGRVYTEPFLGAKPVKYRGYSIPEYFTATTYVIDSLGVKITNDNFKSFKSWSVELLLRVTKAETLEVVRSSVLGARTYKGHQIIGKQFNPADYAPVKASYLVAVSDNRPMLISYAITAALQNHKPTKSNAGGHGWTLSGGRDIAEAELRVLAKSELNKAYVRLDHAFYQEVGRIYNEAVLNGEKPIKTLENTLGKSTKRVQAYVTYCRNLKPPLIAKTTQGKSSKAIKPTAKKGK